MQQFALNALILTGTSLLMRAVGVSFNVFVSNKIGAAGVGLFSLIMSVYMFAVTLASSGINLAVTRLVSEELAENAEAGARRAVRRCFAYALIFGMGAGLLLFFGADFIGLYCLRDERSIPSLYVLSVSLPFIAASNVMSGYFTAVRRVAKSASAQVFEQAVRIGLVVIALNALAPKGITYACVAIVGGGSVSEIVSCLYQYLLYRHDVRRYRKTGKTGQAVTRRMLGIAIPVALSAYIRSALSTVEHLLVPQGLKKSGISSEGALAGYGIIQGMVMPVITFPSAFLNAFSSLLVPELAECHQRGERRQINRIISRVLHVTMLFAIGVCGILVSFPKELGLAIYGSFEAARYMRALAPLVLMLYLDGVVDGMLKGLDQQVSSMRYNIVDSGLGILLVWLLLPRWGLEGYLVVIYVTEMLNVFLSINRLILVTDFKLKLIDWFIKPVAAAFAAAQLVRLFVRMAGGAVLPSAAAVTAYVLAAGILYVVILLCFSCINSEDIAVAKNMLQRRGGNRRIR